MNARLVLILFLALSPIAERFAAAAAQYTNYPVEILRDNWHDAKRDRDVPVKIYFPKSGDGPFPVIIFSHGLGGSREHYEYLGQFWAAHGYVSVHVQHAGSDSNVWQGRPMNEAMPDMRKAVNLENAVNRPKDIAFAIDRLEKLNAENPALKHRLDLSRVGAAGHSFGAFTTLAVAGEVFVSPRGDISFADSRVKAAIAMSSPVPSNPATYDEAFSKIKIPCFHMTGTEDFSPIGDTRPEQRRIPFDHISGADEFLLTFKGGDHMVFSGRSANASEEQFKKLICESSLAFWEAYLKGDAAAKKWLAMDFRGTLGAYGTFEEKLK
jgi:predicted dienelactone hydrolase